MPFFFCGHTKERFRLLVLHTMFDINLNSVGFIVASALMALLLCMALLAFIKQWQRMQKRNSACPPDVECNTRQEEQPKEEEVTVTEEVIPVEPDVFGFVRCPRGTPCDIWDHNEHDRHHHRRQIKGDYQDSMHSGESSREIAVASVAGNDSEGAALFSQTGMVELSTISEVFGATKRPKAVILMYATGCGHCTAMKPAYDTAAKQASCPFYAVDAVKVPDIVEKFKLSGFPTIFKFEQGRLAAEYSGDRSAADLLLFSQQ